jgi:hypothetical protein
MLRSANHCKNSPFPYVVSAATDSGARPARSSLPNPHADVRETVAAPFQSEAWRGFDHSCTGQANNRMPSRLSMDTPGTPFPARRTRPRLAALVPVRRFSSLSR